MKNICQKCSGEYLTLYKDICHQCWNTINTDSISITRDKALTDYRCPTCDKLLFKGNVSSLAMTCPNCNGFVKMDF
jgi:DNA-directed RNA polymerase subunit RPC12/RpoP